MINNKFLLSAFIASALVSGVSYAQSPTQDRATTSSAGVDVVNDNWKPSLVPDGVIDRVQHVGQVLDFKTIRENDAVFEVTVWRMIDIRQKQNMAFRYEGDEYSGGGSFIEILLHAVKTGKIQAYSAFGGTDDRFTAVLTPEDFASITGGTLKHFKNFDQDTQEEKDTFYTEAFNPNVVTKYEIKEKWVMDRNSGRLQNRIVGIAPIMDKYDDNGNRLGQSVMFWVYYPEARKELANYEVYNPENNLHRLTWTDFLDGRYFSSYVVKTSNNNVLNSQYRPNDLRSLQEGQDAFNAIIDRSEALWQQ